MERFLKLFTELPLDEISSLGALKGAAINDAKVNERARDLLFLFFLSFFLSFFLHIFN